MENFSTSFSEIALLNHEELLLRKQIGFLDNHFRPHDDVSSLSSKASDLARELSRNSDELDADLLSLQRKLAKLVLSWIRRSIGVKTTLRKFNHNLQDLSLRTMPQYGIESKMIEKMLTKDLPCLAKELQRIEKLRNYAETTLKLEALVGDLEDAVLHVTRNTGDIFSAGLSSSAAGFGQRKEKAFHAIKTMNNIEDLLVTVVELHPHWGLVKCVDNRVDKILAVFRSQVLADHRALLVSLGWPPKLESGTILDLPNPLVLMKEDKRKSYSESFLLLSALQHLQAQREKRQFNHMGHEEERNIRLWVIDELVSPIASMTEFYFLKWANRPELIFALVYKITRDFVLGVEDVLQPLIDKARLLSYSAKEAWVCAMVHMLSGFLAKTLFSDLVEKYERKQMKSDVISSWIHLIDLMIAFDRKMQSLINDESLLFQCSEGFGFSKGISMLSIFCDRSNWLKIWAKIELKNAWKKLKAELKDERAWVVDDEGGVGFSANGETYEFLLYSKSDHKVPLIAVFAVNITWEMVERCQNLPAILPKVQFIKSTSVRFLRYFFNFLVSRSRKPEYHCVGSPADDFIRRSCSFINAARYCESELTEWSDNVGFLEMSMAENYLTIHREDDDSSFFEEEIKSLVELETAWLIEVIAGLLNQFEALTREYVQMMECFGQKQKEFESVSVSNAVNCNVSVNLVEALDSLRRQLHLIRKELNARDFFDLWRSIADGLDHFIFCRILMGNNIFSDDGINQFIADMQALYSIFQPFCARPEAFFPRVSNSLKLLKMDVEEVTNWQVVSSDDGNRVKILHSCGISHMSFDQAMKILSRKDSIRARLGKEK